MIIDFTDWDEQRKYCTLSLVRTGEEIEFILQNNTSEEKLTFIIPADELCELIKSLLL